MEGGTIEVHVSSLSIRLFRTSLELSDFSNDGRSINFMTPDAMYGSAKGIFSRFSIVSVFCLLCIAGSNVDDADNSDVAVVTAVAVLVVVVAGVEEGKEDGSRTNYSQLLPYTSKDVRDYDGVYQDLHTAFRDVFEWIAEQVSYVLHLWGCY